jgi:murein DD-endopeptidase MepM/ murein hydrolase activator NlpD
LPTTSSPTTTVEAKPLEILPEEAAVTPVPTPAAGWPVRNIVFPVVGPSIYSDTWGAYRGTIATHFHIGVDIIGVRLQPLVAATNGTITHFVNDHPTAGWGVVVTDSEGWEYRYYHMNNDKPGTDDGSNPTGWRFAPGLALGDYVKAGQLLGYMGDSGDSETSVPHVHFEIHRPDGSAVNPYPSVRGSEKRTRCAPPAELARPAGFILPTDTDAMFVDVILPNGLGVLEVSTNGTVFFVKVSRPVGSSGNEREDGPCSS